MEGILEQLLAEIRMLNEHLSSLNALQCKQNPNDKKKITEDMLPSMITVEDIKSLLYCGITRAYKIINNPEFTKLKWGRRACIPKEQFLKWHEKEQHRRALGIK